MKYAKLIKFTPILIAIVLLGVPRSKPHVDNKPHDVYIVTKGVTLYFVYNNKILEKVFIIKQNAETYVEKFENKYAYNIHEIHLKN